VGFKHRQLIVSSLDCNARKRGFRIKCSNKVAQIFFREHLTHWIMNFYSYTLNSNFLILNLNTNL